MAPSALIFDCDGTLVDSTALHCRAWALALASVGADMQDSWYFARTGIPGAELLRQFREEFGVAFEPDVVVAEQVRYFLANLHTVSVIDRVAALARDARAPIAVASGGDRPIVEATLRAVGLRSLFSVVVTVDDVARGKPHPDLFLEAARRLHVAPSECLAYEDSDHGLEAARRAGMRAIDVRTFH
jgi:HAD superfamily hydrolase (TIGR01509 family)